MDTSISTTIIVPFLSFIVLGMITMGVEKLVSDIKLSSVVPGMITREDKVHELSNMDLIMKLHYIKGLYFFNSDATEGVTIFDIKKAMFHFLELYYQTSGRIRRSGDGGRPFIKCNDSGVRIIEAKCSKTIDEWLGMNDPCVNEQLVYDQVLGPDLGFAPLVFVQFTWFKCGGMSIGLSWAHVLGDAFAASNFINMWAQTMSAQLQPHSLHNPISINPSSSLGRLPFSLKRVDPVGDHWQITHTCKMQSYSFHVTQKQLNQLFFNIHGTKLNPFHVISAMIWKILAKVRGDSSEPMIATFIRRDMNRDVSSNSQVISIVEANVKISEIDIAELAKLIAEKAVDENRVIEELMEKENGTSDFVVYGANLTFVNLEDAEFYGLQLNAKKPVFASFNISGVGEEGVVLVLPGPQNLKGREGGRVVNLNLPQDQLAGFKNELREELGAF